MANMNLGKIIEGILSKIRKEKGHQMTEEAPSGPSEPVSPTIPQSTETPLISVSATLRERIYLKALPLRSVEDADLVKQEVQSGNIVIVKVSPLAKKSIEDVKRVVTELCDFSGLVGGDIARLGEERVVITPSSVKIWREKAETTEIVSTAA